MAAGRGAGLGGDRRSLGSSRGIRMCPPPAAHGPPRLQGRSVGRLKPVLRPLTARSEAPGRAAPRLCRNPSTTGASWGTDELGKRGGGGEKKIARLSKVENNRGLPSREKHRGDGRWSWSCAGRGGSPSPGGAPRAPAPGGAGRGRPGCASPSSGRERGRHALGAERQPGKHGGAAREAGAWPAVCSRRGGDRGARSAARGAALRGVRRSARGGIRGVRCGLRCCAG